jgi:3-hydroxyisobutyrate dehydrogenase-like beta-hydroxyacid dehydrogenase
MGNSKVAFVGLGAMGWGMATHLLRSGFPVVGYDVFKPVVDRLVAEGGEAATSPRDAATKKNIETFVCMVATLKQANSVFFDRDTGVVNNLPKHTTILLCITASPEYVMDLRKQIDDFGRSDLGLIDCPVSGGANRAADGTLTILASGSSAALAAADSVLQCMSMNLHIIPGGIGSGSKVKLVHQIFVGVNIAVASEVIGLAMLAKLDIKEVYDEIMKGDGASWLFGQRVPHMWALDQPPYSSLAIITKDMVSLFEIRLFLHNCRRDFQETQERLNRRLGITNTQLMHL